jgi:hypothetical protein
MDQPGDQLKWTQYMITEYCKHPPTITPRRVLHQVRSTLSNDPPHNAAHDAALIKAKLFDDIAQCLKFLSNNRVSLDMVREFRASIARYLRNLAEYRTKNERAEEDRAFGAICDKLDQIEDDYMEIKKILNLVNDSKLKNLYFSDPDCRTTSDEFMRRFIKVQRLAILAASTPSNENSHLFKGDYSVVQRQRYCDSIHSLTSKIRKEWNKQFEIYSELIQQRFNQLRKSLNKKGAQHRMALFIEENPVDKYNRKFYQVLYSEVASRRDEVAEMLRELLFEVAVPPAGGETDSLVCDEPSATAHPLATHLQQPPKIRCTALRLSDFTATVQQPSPKVVECDIPQLNECVTTLLQPSPKVECVIPQLNECVATEAQQPSPESETQAPDTVFGYANILSKKIKDCKHSVQRDYTLFRRSDLATNEERKKLSNDLAERLDNLEQMCEVVKITVDKINIPKLSELCFTVEIADKDTVIDKILELSSDCSEDVFSSLVDLICDIEGAEKGLNEQLDIYTELITEIPSL